MIIAIYTTQDPNVPAARRCLAQFEQTKPRLIFSFYGADEAEARIKAQSFWDKTVVPNSPLKGQTKPVVKPAYDPMEDLL